MLNVNNLTQNIKALRISKGLSQNDLASRLGVSPQCVSKWECGRAIPSIDNLCLLSEILNVSTDMLLNGHKDDRKVMIGIDSGSAQMVFICFSEDGSILAHNVFPPCNPNTSGVEKCAAVLKKGINELIGVFPTVCGIYVGGSGFFTNNNGDKIKTLLKKAYPHLVIDCKSDVTNVISAASEDRSCIAVICDAGSVVCVKEKQNLIFLSGWQCVFGKVGNGADIGRDAILAALKDRENLGDRTEITELIETRLNAPLADVVNLIYSNKSAQFAEVVPIVFKAYEKGDKVAENIIEENAERLAYFINCVAKKYSHISTVVISGSVVSQNDVFGGVVGRYLDRRLNVIISKYPQGIGACLLAAKMMGVENSLLREKLAENYKSQANQYNLTVD